jgi:hypothetical protein
VQISYRNAKAAKDFIPGGTTQNSFQISVVKRIKKDFEVQGWVQYERWQAPVYKTGTHNDARLAARITWYPHEQK